MKLFRLGCLFGTAVVASLLLFSISTGTAAEQQYPSRSVELFIPYGPGGSIDLMNRVLAKKLENYFGVSVIPQTKPGGGGLVLASYIANNAAPDGYTIANLVPDHIIQPVLRGTATFNVDDFYLIGQLCIIPCVLTVAADSPWKNYQEFSEYAKANPGVKYAHPGVNTTLFLRTENYNKQSGLKMINVPMKGDSEVIAAVLGHHVQVGVMSAGAAKAQVEAGKFKIIFSFDPPEQIGFPADTPSLRSLFGTNYVDLEPCQVMAVSAKTPADVIQKLEKAWEATIKDPEYIERLTSVSLRIGYLDGKALMKAMPERTAIVKEMLQKVGDLK